MSTPQATPKHLTDEELRQQYGIQLASRPQEDTDGKEAKWADIDDDEDDWAPETIEWNDGTKINLSQVDQKAALAEEEAAAAAVAAAAAAARERELEATKTRSLIAKSTGGVGPSATVLKLGSSAQPKSSGLVLKGSSEKPTLVAKPSAANSVKSPWASLPPVDKVSPVPINPQSQPQQSRFGQRDIHGFDAMPPLPIHAKEIAADDFSRSARETVNGMPRELFNSQSGRYEPVSEPRRGSSVRKEQNFRAPSLLQRPSQNDQHSPAEPSPAFQTSRSGQGEAGVWNRRRGSSTVSGESGNYGRRMSVTKGFEIQRAPGDSHQHRPDSQSDHPRFVQRGPSPAQSHGQSIASQSPTVSLSQHVGTNESVIASPQQVQAQLPPFTSLHSVIADGLQDPVAVQKKLMREKREAAIKRKKEEEAREEAEKKERIRLKMEKLGLVDRRPVNKDDVEGPASTPVILTKHQHSDVQSVVSRSPPKPPVPNVSGEPQQYGMMKVHAPQITTVQPPKSATVERTAPEVAKVEEIPLASVAQHKSSPPPALVPATPNGIVVSQIVQEVKATQSSEARVTEPSSDTRQQTWQSLPQGPGGYSTWNGNGMTTHSSPGGNLWGPPTNSRALGNGDFQHSVQRPQSRPMPYQAQVSPPQQQPIGPPRPIQQTRGMQSSSKLAEPPVRTGTEDSQTVPSFPSPESLPLPTTTQAPLQPMAEHIPFTTQAPPPAMIMSNTSAQKILQPSEPPKTGLSAWATFGATAAKLDAERNDRAIQEHAARLAEEQRTGIRQDLRLPAMHETWRQVRTSEATGQRHVVSALKTQNKLQSLQQGPQITGDLPSEVLPKSTVLPPAPPQVRSRYQDIFEQNQRAVSLPLSFSRPASPVQPPPDSTDHPAYIASGQRPLVNLPGSKPKSMNPRPTVRLPPSTQPAKPIPVMHDERTPSQRAVSQPLAATASWQDRFNGLFDRKLSPEKKFADVANFSSSKVPLELVSMADSAAVTLPPQDELISSTQLLAIDLQAKNVEDEDALFEERDFGSVPTVRIPAKAPVLVWNPAKSPNAYRDRLRILTGLDIQSVIAMLPGAEDIARPSGFPVIVRISCMSTPRTKIIPRSSAYGVLRPAPTNPTKGKPRNGPKHRDSSATHKSPKLGQDSGTRSSVKPSNQQIRTKTNPSNMSWARRASGVE